MNFGRIVQQQLLDAAFPLRLGKTDTEGELDASGATKCAVMSVATTTTSWSEYDKSNNDYNTNKAEDRK